MKLFPPKFFIGLILFTMIFFVGQSTQAQQSVPKSGVQKVIAPAGVLNPNDPGVTLWQDYGAFALYAVTDTALSSLSSYERSQIDIANDMDRILLDAYPFDTQKEAVSIPQEWRTTAPDGPALQLIQFVGPIKADWLKQIEAAGAAPIHYIANNAYLVWADNSAQTTLAGMAADKEFLQFSAPYEPYFKLGPTLREADLNSNELVTVTIQMYKHDGRFATEAIVKNMLVQSLSNWTSILAYQNLIGVVHASDIPTLVQQPDVVWVGERLARELHDEVQNQILAGNLNGDQSGPSGVGYFTWLNSYGFSQDPDDYPVVDITDDGIGTGSVTSGDATFHEFGSISNPTRLTYVSSCAANPSGEGPDGHGHINTSIVGGYDSRTGFPFQDPNGYLRGVGVNPYGRMAGTRIFAPSYDISGCGGTDTGVIKHSQDNGAQISTNSWGCSSCAGSYDDGSQAYDVGVRDADLTESGNQELMIVFSAGNSGELGANTIGTPGNGKNMLTVGASENPRPSDESGSWTDGCGIGPSGADDAMDIIGFSSRGPAPGGRIKPEVIAPGTHIQGTASTHPSYNGSGVCDQYRPGGQTVFAASSGTSHSTPAVAGVSSLVYYWLQNNQPVAGEGAGYIPSPAAVKAYVMNHPTYLTGVSANDTLPSNAQGYGMPNMGVMFDATPKYVLDQSVVFDNTGETWTWNGAVADSSKPVRIMMVYTDKAGAIGTSPQVNNLNLAATVGANSYLGNRFSGEWSTTGGTADAANNYEAIFLPPGTTGAIEITITAFNVADDGVPNYGDSTDQDFALVCYNCAQNPDFTILATPSSLNICTPDNAVYNVAVGSILGYAETINLSATGNPAGTTAVFGANSGTSPFDTTLTLGNTGAAAFGSYDIAVTGMGPTSTYTSTVSLNAFTAVPAAPTLTAPGNGDTDVPLAPTFTWSATSQSQSYYLEVATDAGFSNVVYSATVVGASHAMDGYNLDAETVYYWRVQATNICGDSAYSATSSFTTVLLFCVAPNAPITDNNTTLSNLVSSRPDVIGDLNVYVQIAHTFIGDLDITLTNQATGSQVVLLPASFSCSGDNIDATFDDEASAAITCGTTVPALSGEVRPSGSLGTFDYEALAGTWQIAVRDSAGGDTGTLIQWCLQPQFASGIGAVAGTVTDANTTDPLAGVAITLDDGVNAYNALTNAAGEYSRAAGSGTYTVTAVLADYTTAQATGVAVTDGVTTTQDFALNAGIVTSSADDFAATLELAASTTLPWNLSNTGTAALNYDIRIVDGGYSPSFAPQAGEDILVVANDTTAATAMETALTTLGFTYLRVTPAVFQSMTVPELLAYKAVFHTGTTGFTGAAGASETLLLAYMDAGGYLYISDNDLGYYRNGSPFYDTYLQAAYVGDDPGINIIIGEDFMAGLSADITADPFPDHFTVRSEGTRILSYQGGNAAGVAVNRLGYKAVYTSFDYDDIASAADELAFMDAITGFLIDTGDYWLSTNIEEGTLAVGADQDIVVTMDANNVALAGNYYADLVVQNNTPYGDIVIPVTMTVTAPQTYGFLEGTVRSQGYCDSDPFPAAGALVEIAATGGMTWTLEADANGYYSIWLDEAYSPLSITVTAPEHEMGYTAGVAIIGAETTTQDFALRWLKPCLNVDPTSMSEVVLFGQTMTQSLFLGNSGAYTLTFELREQDGGFSPAFNVQVVPAGTVDASRQIAPTLSTSDLTETGIATGKAILAPASGGLAPADIGDSWEMMAALPSGRVFSAVVADQNGYVYVMGGTSDGGASIPTNTNYRYDANSDSWSTMAPLPAAVDSIDGVEINNKIYLPGSAVSADIYVYDIGSDSWSTIPANGGYTARSQHQVVAIDTNVYVLGGIVTAPNASTTEVWVLDTTTGTWTAGTPMQKSRTSFSAAAIDGEIYVAGGVQFPGFTPDMTAEKFDGTSWSYIADLPAGGGAYTRWSYNADGHGADGLWLAGGRRDADWNVLDHAGYYDPSTDTWIDSPTIPALSQGRVYMEGAVAADGYFYVIGGRNGDGTVAYNTNERLYVGAVMASDVLWLSQDVTTGTIAPDGGEQEIIVTFDASAVMEPGDYFANIRVISNDPLNGSYVIPVTMTVYVATYGVEMTPAEAAQSGLPGEVVTYTLTLTNTGNVTDTYAIAINGETWSVTAPASVSVNAGLSSTFDVAVTIPADAEDADFDVATVTVTSVTDALATDSADLTTTAVITEYYIYLPVILKP